MSKEQTILILDFGGQYKQLIARRVRECNVYCEIHPYNMKISAIKELSPRGIILTGGPNSVYGDEAVLCDKELFELGIPVLGICYGSQLMAHMLGGEVKTAPVSEYGKTRTYFEESIIFKEVSNTGDVWMSHTDYIAKAPEGFKISADTANCPIAAMENVSKKFYAVQFHPEVLHTNDGTKMLRNFVMDICGCEGSWRMDNFVSRTVEEIKNKVGSGKALCALSGGVDSSVAAVLMSKAIGKQLTCVFVDHGLLRKNEADEVEEVFGAKGAYELNFIRVDAKERF